MRGERSGDGEAPNGGPAGRATTRFRTPLDAFLAARAGAAPLVYTLATHNGRTTVSDPSTRIVDRRALGLV